MAMHIGDLLTAVIGVVVGLALLPVVNDAIATAQANTTSSTLDSLLGIVPMLYIIVIVVGMVAYVVVKGKSN